MQKVDYLGFCRSYSKTKPIFGFLVSCAIQLHQFFDRGSHGLINTRGKCRIKPQFFHVQMLMADMCIEHKMVLKGGPIHDPNTDFETCIQDCSCSPGYVCQRVFFLIYIYNAQIALSIYRYSCIKFHSSEVERLPIHQSILCFVGSNPDVSTLFFQSKTYILTVCYWR